MNGSNQHICEYCQRPLHGRADQRFCNDTCRNSFNRKIKLAERILPHPNAKEIIKIIKKNYEILKKRLPGSIENDDLIYYDVDVFFNTGIDTRFYTSVFIDIKGLEWYCVFDRGYSINGNEVCIKDLPTQADL